MNFILYNKLSTWGLFCTDYTVDPECYQTPIIGIMLLWKRHVVTTCSDMDFYIGSILTAVKQTTTVVLTRELTLISVNWTVLLYFTDRVPARCGRSVLCDLLNDVKWRCTHCRWASPTQFTALTVTFLSAQMFIQTQDDGRDKLEGVNWQMRCVIISMTYNTAVARCGVNYTAARHLFIYMNVSSAGIMVPGPGSPETWVSKDISVTITVFFVTTVKSPSCY